MSTREPPPVMGENELFVTEESIGHVENFYLPADVDKDSRQVRKVVSKPPVLDPEQKWYGTSSSDPDRPDPFTP